MSSSKVTTADSAVAAIMNATTPIPKVKSGKDAASILTNEVASASATSASPVAPKKEKKKKSATAAEDSTSSVAAAPTAAVPNGSKKSKKEKDAESTDEKSGGKKPKKKMTADEKSAVFKGLGSKLPLVKERMAFFGHFRSFPNAVTHSDDKYLGELDQYRCYDAKNTDVKRTTVVKFTDLFSGNPKLENKIEGLAYTNVKLFNEMFTKKTDYRALAVCCLVEFKLNDAPADSEPQIGVDLLMWTNFINAKLHVATYETLSAPPKEKEQRKLTADSYLTNFVIQCKDYLDPCDEGEITIDAILSEFRAKAKVEHDKDMAAAAKVREAAAKAAADSAAAKAQIESKKRKSNILPQKQVSKALSINSCPVCFEELNDEKKCNSKCEYEVSTEESPVKKLKPETASVSPAASPAASSSSSSSSSSVVPSPTSAASAASNGTSTTDERNAEPTDV